MLYAPRTRAQMGMRTRYRRAAAEQSRGMPCLMRPPRTLCHAPLVSNSPTPCTHICSAARVARHALRSSASRCCAWHRVPRVVTLFDPTVFSAPLLTARTSACDQRVIGWTCAAALRTFACAACASVALKQLGTARTTPHKYLAHIRRHPAPELHAHHDRPVFMVSGVAAFVTQSFRPKLRRLTHAMTKPCVCSLQDAVTSVRTTATTTAPLLSVADLRVNYSKQPLEEASLPEHPVELFSTWFQQAQQAKEPEPNAMCLSTADLTGRPSARMVLLKAFDHTGFVWYTNYQSRKASQLEHNPFASLTFWWPSLERSVRVEGEVMRVASEESDAYFHSRPASSRLGAVASDQSRPLDSRQTMERRWDELQSAHLNEQGELIRPIQRPSHWGGYRLIPDRVEFWKGRSARLHDRIVFERTLPRIAQSSVDKLAIFEWRRQRLQP